MEHRLRPVAYVEVVTADYIEVTDDNYGSNVTDRWRIARSSPAWPDNFIHLRDLATSPPPPPPPPPDADGDGVPDGEDHCPPVAGDTKDGCPSIAGAPFDANGDGRTDLVHRWSQGVNTWLSNGDGTYAIRGQGAQAGYGFGDGQWPASVYSLALLRRPPAPPAPTGAAPGSPAPAPASGGTKPGAKVRCVVPKLKGLTVKRATKRLRARHCRLGKVRRGKGGRRAVIVRQSRPAGRRLKRGTRIDVRLGRPRHR